MNSYEKNVVNLSLIKVNIYREIKFLEIKHA